MRALSILFALLCLLGPAVGAASAQAYYYQKPSLVSRLLGYSGSTSVNPYYGGNYGGWITLVPDQATQAAQATKAAHKHHHHWL